MRFVRVLTLENIKALSSHKLFIAVLAELRCLTYLPLNQTKNCNVKAYGDTS